MPKQNKPETANLTGFDLSPEQRRHNRVLQVHATLALAGSNLTVAQVEAVLREQEAEHAALVTKTAQPVATVATEQR